MNQLQQTPNNFLSTLQKSHSNCKSCALFQQAKQGVPGIGSENPKVLLLGEGPGREEDLAGQPFVGRAGQLLRNILFECLLLKWEDIYITNCVKHRPPDNRNPTREEILACAEHALIVEIEEVAPKLIVCLGRVPTQALALISNYNLPSGSLRGYTFKYEDIPVLSTWHPAYILRRQDKRQELVDDLAKAFTGDTI